MKNEKLYSKNKPFFEIFFCLAFFVAQTYLMILSPIIGDDIFNSTLKGFYTLHDKNIYEIIYIYIRDWLVVNGRVHFSEAPIKIIFFQFFDTLLSIKLAHYIINFISVLSFIYFVYLSSKKNIFFTLLIFLVIPTLFQYRDWHDPFLMFPTYSLLVFYYFTSLIFLLKFFESNKKFFYFISIFLYILACGTYEPALFLSIFFLYLDFKKYRKFKYSYAYVLISIIFLSIIIYFKFLGPFFFGPQESILFSKGGGYDGTQINFDLYKSFLTIFLQFIGSLPLIFLIAKQNISFNLIDLFIFIFYGIFLFYFIKKNKKKLFNGIDFKQYFALNVVIFISIIPIGLSGKYIFDIPNKGLGYAHLPVYLQYYGICLILLYIIFKIIKSDYKYKNLIISISITIIAFLNYSSNKNVIHETLFPQKILRENVSDFLRKGLINNINEYSNIVFWESNYQLWKRPEFITTHSKKKMFVQYGYDKGFFDLKLSDDNKSLLVGDKGIYMVDKFKIASSGKKFVFKKNKNQISNLNEFIKLSDKNSEEIYNNSDKVYIIINLPNFEDNRIILAKINSFDIGKFKNIKNIYSKELYLFSEKNGLSIITLDDEINLNNFINNTDPQNPKIKFDKSNFNVFLNKVKNTNNNLENSDKGKINSLNDNFFDGKFICNIDTLKVSTLSNLIFGFVNLDYERIKVRIYNNSNSLWDINNFEKINPITIRSYLKDSKTNKTIASINLSHKKIKINKGDYKDFYINFNDLIKIKSFVYNKKNYDKLIFSLVREGYQWFPENEFKPCIINLKRD